MGELYQFFFDDLSLNMLKGKKSVLMQIRIARMSRRSIKLIFNPDITGFFHVC